MGVGTTCRTRLVTGQSPNPRRWLSPRFRLKQPAPASPLFDRYEADYGTGLSSLLSAATRRRATVQSAIQLPSHAPLIKRVEGLRF